MTRTRPTTTWTRNRFTNNLLDVSGRFIQDVSGNQIQGLSNENMLVTPWN